MNSVTVFKKEPRLEPWKMDKKGTLYIAESLMNEIEYLHRMVGALEWCGPLIYEKLEGDLIDPETFKLRAHHVFPMDIGSGAHTSASFDPVDIVDLYEEHPGLMDGAMKQGLIHTHHNMSTFFSGVDMDELHDNTPNHNYYLSLIVNFRGEWCAKVAFIATVNEKRNKVFKFKSTDDQEASFGNSDESEMKVLMMIEMDIVKEGADTLSQEFKDRFLKLQEAKKTASSKPHGGTTVYSSNGGVTHKDDVTGRAPGYGKGEVAQGGSPDSYQGKSSMEQGQLWQDLWYNREQKEKEEKGTGSSKRSSEDFEYDESWGGEFGWGNLPVQEAEETFKEGYAEGRKDAKKSSEKTPLGKLARMSESEAKEICLEWLNQGIMPELEMNRRKFATVYEALSYFDKFWEHMTHDPNYSYWLDCMATSLYEVAYAYAPALIAVKIPRLLDTWLTNNTVAVDLHTISDKYDDYFDEMERIRKQRKITL